MSCLHRLYRQKTDVSRKEQGRCGAACRWLGKCAAAAGLLMMAYGAYRGEVKVVMEKAVNICLECIGIG